MGEPKIGPTGDYPQGKLNPDDEGGLNMGITVQGDKVMLNFGKPVGWIGMGAAEAEALGNMLVEKAKQARGADLK